MERTILHADLNNFFASVECLYRPELTGKPVAVTGDPALRHGIVLAKNDLAKRCGVKTGNPLWMARQACPDIVFVEPHYDLYMRYSEAAKEIYGSYTELVEPFGIDECWLDVTGSRTLFGDGRRIADDIRARIRSELGVTVSVGVSYNKIFAKLGSDLKKPDATTVIESDRFREIVWPLGVEELLYVGRSTRAMLRRYGINTIGALATTELRFLEYLFGKTGTMLWLFANGRDVSPVANIGAKSLIRSIGNGTTAPRDLLSEDDLRITLEILSESVSARLREYRFIAGTIQLEIRYSDLSTLTRQEKLAYPNRTAKSIFELAFSLCQRTREPNRPIRSLCVRATDLSLPGYEQLTFLPDIARLQRAESVEATVDSLRRRFGADIVRRGILLTDPSISGFHLRDEHTVHSDGFFS